MTVIQTVAGGAGGSGQVIDARNVTLASINGSLASGSNVMMPYPTGGYDMEIALEGRTIKVRNYLVARQTGGYYKYVDPTTTNAVKAGIENLLPDLSDGTYRIITMGCGTTGNNQSYWTLEVSNGTYTLSYSQSGLYYYTSPIPVTLLSIAKIS